MGSPFLLKNVSSILVLFLLNFAHMYLVQGPTEVTYFEDRYVFLSMTFPRFRVKSGWKQSLWFVHVHKHTTVCSAVNCLICCRTKRSFPVYMVSTYCMLYLLSVWRLWCVPEGAFLWSTDVVILLNSLGVMAFKNWLVKIVKKNWLGLDSNLPVLTVHVYGSVAILWSHLLLSCVIHNAWHCWVIIL